MLTSYLTAVLWLILFSIFFMCISEKFNVSNVILNVDSNTVVISLYGVYNDYLYITAAYTPTNEYRINISSIFNGDPYVWETRTIPSFNYSGSSIPTYMFFHGQCIVQNENEIYAAFPDTNPNAYDYKVLLRYDFNTHSYADTNTYYAVVNSVRFNPCMIYNPNFNILYILSALYTEYYNISDDSWANFSSPIVQLRYMGCAMDIDFHYIFKFGGYTGSIYYNTIEKYNISNDTWNIITATLKVPMIRVPCITHPNTKIYCIGGSISSITGSAVVHIFDPHSSSIDFVSYELNVARFLHRLVIYNDCIIVIGGNGIYSIEYLCIPISNSTIPPSTLSTIVPSSIYPTILPSNFPTIAPLKLPTNVPTTISPFISSTNKPTTYSYAPTFVTISPTKIPTVSVINSQLIDTNLILIVSLIVLACLCVIALGCIVGYCRRKLQNRAVIHINEINNNNIIENAEIDPPVQLMQNMQRVTPMNVVVVQPLDEKIKLPEINVNSMMGEESIEDESDGSGDEGVTDGTIFQRNVTEYI